MVNGRASAPPREEPTVTTSIDLNKIMARVQALLAKADSTTHSPEAAALRGKAEELMRQYRIAEEHLIATDQAAIEPEVHRLWMGPYTDPTRGSARDSRPTSYYVQWYQLLRAAAEHAGCLLNTESGRNEETREWGLFGILVGYPGDLRLAELVFTNARMVFGERVEPKVDPKLSVEENIYRLRSAGITRRKVAQMVLGEDTHAAHAKVGMIYKEECLKRGEIPVLDGRGVSASAYRDAFANAFVEEFVSRLREARNAADSTGGALVLHGRKERVQERFWQEFPELRPRAKTEVAETEPEPATPTRQRQRKPWWETAAGRAKIRRLYSGAGALGIAAGTQAAKEVQIDRVQPAKRISEPQRAPSGELGS